MSLTIRPLLAEAFGAFLLALAVGSSVHMPVATPVVAGLVLMTLVYILGPISGAHVNPAVTIGLYSTGAMKLQNALLYILSQMIGGSIALFVLSTWSTPPAPDALIMPGSLGEMLGALVLAFGVITVVQGKVPAVASGIVVGGSLFSGVLVVSSMAGGVLNPAVALGVGAFSWSAKQLLVFGLMPLVGGVIGAQFAKALQK